MVAMPGIPARPLNPRRPVSAALLSCCRRCQRSSADMPIDKERPLYTAAGLGASRCSRSNNYIGTHAQGNDERQRFFLFASWLPPGSLRAFNQPCCAHSIKMEKGTNGMECVTLRSGQSSATVYLHGAHLTSWTVAGKVGQLPGAPY